jgi:hypothetical protein
VLAWAIFNVSSSLGTSLAVLLIAAYMMTEDPPWVTIKNTFSLKNIMFGLIGFGIFIIGSSLVGALIAGKTISLNSVITFIGATTPIFEKSATINFVIWSIIIPFVENLFFFFALLPVLLRTFNVPINIKAPKAWIVASFVSAVFMIFHLTARAIDPFTLDATGLITTFVFGMVCCLLTIYTKDIGAANVTHITSNSLAMANKLFGFSLIGA